MWTYEWVGAKDDAGKFIERRRPQRLEVNEVLSRLGVDRARAEAGGEDFDQFIDLLREVERGAVDGAVFGWTDPQPEGEGETDG